MDTLTEHRTDGPCPACTGTGTRPGIAVRPRVFPGCNRPRLPEAVAQLMVCSTCRGTGTVWAVA